MWLLTGGTLVLHHPFDDQVLEDQINDHACDTLVAPAPLGLRLGELDLAARLPSLRNVIGAPEQVGASASWTAREATLTDVYLFGEAGLFGARRNAEDGSPAPIKPGLHGAPREVPGSAIAGEILLTPKGTLGLRGPMVPVAAYAPPPAPSDTLIAPPPRDYVTPSIRRGLIARPARSTSPRRHQASWRSVATASSPTICRNGRDGWAKARC